MKNKYGDEVYIDDLVPAILTADSTDLEDILYWIGQRYAQLFPQWEVCHLALEKRKDRTEQINRVIVLLERLKLEGCPSSVTAYTVPPSPRGRHGNSHRKIPVAEIIW